MYVRKFQGESIDETIKVIKKELRPEAIILKTETFKGIKSALKKSKVEITAAVTEKNLKKKMNVDRVLDESQKEAAYSAPADYLVDMIDGYDQTNENLNSRNVGYGNISLNKNVQSKNEEKNNQVVNELVNTSALDNFLSTSSSGSTVEIDQSTQKESVIQISEQGEGSGVASEPILVDPLEQFKTEFYKEITNLKNSFQNDEMNELRKKGNRA